MKILKIAAEKIILKGNLICLLYDFPPADTFLNRRIKTFQHMAATPTATDDIDLLVLAERALSFFRRFRWLFILAMAAGLASGYLFYKALPKVYKSSMMLHSYLLTNPEQISMVSNWNDLLGKAEYAALAQELHCPEPVLHQVKKIKAEELQQVFTAQNPNGFRMDVWVTDNAVLSSLQTALVNGFENASYVKDRLQEKRENLETLIRTTQSEITKLENTKKQIEAIISGEQRAGTSLLVNGSDINRQLIEMNEKLLSFKENLRFTRAVQVLQPFTAFRKPADPKLLSWLIIGAVFFTVLAYVYAMGRILFERLQQRKQNPPAKSS